jgi:hypothetical protein
MSHPYNLISYRVSNICTPQYTMKTKSINQSSLSGVLAKAKGPKKKRAPTHKKGERFLKGPIPWNWIVEAANISGGALKVSLALWYLAGITKTGTIKLSNGVLEELGITRRTKYRVLKALESSGLISVSQRSGNSPEITINPVNQLDGNVHG